MEAGFHQGRGASQNIIRRAIAICGGNAKTGRSVALGIEVEHHHALADSRQRRAEIDGGRGFANATLLIGNRNDARPCDTAAA